MFPEERQGEWLQCVKMVTMETRAGSPCLFPRVLSPVLISYSKREESLYRSTCSASVSISRRWRDNQYRSYDESSPGQNLNANLVTIKEEYVMSRMSWRNWRNTVTLFFALSHKAWILSNEHFISAHERPGNLRATTYSWPMFSVFVHPYGEHR